MPQRFMVTSALPYANGPIHFGHVAGAYLPADIFVRYKRLTGADVLYICGTDEHGAPILANAEREGVPPREYADRWHEAIKESFARLDIDFDNFSRTSRPVHYEQTTRFFADLYKNGFITSKVEDHLYCESCKRGLPDRYVVGVCPECKFEEARGDECPKCGHAHDATDLLEPRCKSCERPASKKPSRHWYLDLPKLKDRLDLYHAERYPSWRQSVVGEVSKYMNDLRDRPITRDLSWGVPVPLEEAKDKVFYVWFDAPIGYISSTIEWAKRQGLPDDAWKRWWQDPETHLVHFIGKDNIFFHCIIWPAMLLGQDESYRLPDVPANEFLNLEGRKFNTSSGWFISIDEFLDRYPSDTLRWTLTRGAPETRDSEFTYKEFQTRVNTELLGTFGNFANRILKFVRSRYGGKVPGVEAAPGEAEQQALAALVQGVEEVGAALDEFSPRTAAQELLKIGYAANKLIERTQPFKTIKDDPARAATTLNTACRILEGLAVLLSPFVPQTAGRIWSQLGLEGAPSERRWQDAASPADPAGRTIGKPEHLFKKIEDETVTREVAALEARAAASAPTPKIEAAPVKPEISYETFQSLDIRIATVTAAEAVKKTDKLVRLELEAGAGEGRTVVAGIREQYAPEELVGRQVVYLANLAPRKMRGVLSQGMLLAANDAGHVPILLQPDRPSPDGAPIS